MLPGHDVVMDVKCPLAASAVAASAWTTGAAAEATDGYQRGKGRSHSVEEQISTHSSEAHATSCQDRIVKLTMHTVVNANTWERE